MADLGFPKDPAELDEAWFTEALRSTGTIGDGVEVTGFTAEQAHPVDVEHGRPGRAAYSACEPAECAERCSLPAAPIHTVLAFMNSYMPSSVSSRP